MPGKKQILSAAVVVLLSTLLWFWHGRSAGESDPAESTVSGDVVAPVAKVKRADIGDSLSIAGAFKPFQEVDIHAKVSGYIRAMHVDVGDHVKTGQVLAVLEIPELAAELSGAQASVRRWQEEIRRAQGDVERAQSAHTAAHSAFLRLKQAADSRAGLVAQQEVDDSQAKDLEAEAQVASAKAAFSSAQEQLQVANASEQQYKALSSYTRIIAPFDGVITTRYADTGALIAAGTSSSTQSLPVVRLAQYSVLRLVLEIPESVAAQIRLGQSMKVHVPAINAEIEGKVSRFADALNEQTRTMETEIDFENHDNRLIPGMYAQATISVNQQLGVLTIPLEAVLHKDERNVALVVNARNIVEERQIELPREGSTRAVVLSGLAEGERVIVGGHGEFHPGQKVVPKVVDAGTPGGEGSR
jgi:RND family efflux transporter MFP subunit